MAILLKSKRADHRQTSPRHDLQPAPCLAQGNSQCGHPGGEFKVIISRTQKPHNFSDTKASQRKYVRGHFGGMLDHMIGKFGGYGMTRDDFAYSL